MVTCTTHCSDMFIVAKTLIALYLIGMVYFIFDTFRGGYDDRPNRKG